MNHLYLDLRQKIQKAIPQESTLKKAIFLNQVRLTIILYFKRKNRVNIRIFNRKIYQVLRKKSLVQTKLRQKVLIYQNLKMNFRVKGKRKPLLRSGKILAYIVKVRNPICNSFLSYQTKVKATPKAKATGFNNIPKINSKKIKKSTNPKALKRINLKYHNNSNSRRKNNLYLLNQKN